MVCVCIEQKFSGKKIERGDEEKKLYNGKKSISNVT